MVCVGAPPSDRAVGAALRYFAGRATAFTTQRIGLTSADRRLVPLTRDYQYAAARFGDLAGTAERSGDDDGWAPAVSYVDYAGDVADVLAMCLTGFPSFDQAAAQRRSLIYVGPATLRAPGEIRPALFDTDAVRELARTAHVQLNVVTTGAGGDQLASLADETGGLAFSGEADVAAHLAEIRKHPPEPTPVSEEQAEIVRPVETPDIPLLLALAALTALVGWPLVVRR
jgi:hypothetical protein